MDKFGGDDKKRGRNMIPEIRRKSQSTSTPFQMTEIYAYLAETGRCRGGKSRFSSGSQRRLLDGGSVLEITKGTVEIQIFVRYRQLFRFLKKIAQYVSERAIPCCTWMIDWHACN